MKPAAHIILFLSSLLASAQGVRIDTPDSLQNSTTQNPRITFYEQEYDFGSFEPVGNDTLKTHSFRFYNTGQQPLVILHVATGCGCTRPQYPKTPILPGDSGTVTVNYKGYGQPVGRFRKSVTVYSNDPRSYTRIFVSGTLKNTPIK